MGLEFPNSRNGWKLDAVGLLAVIGETTTETCVEPMTASYLCLLPRLIPAPQALIRPNRRIALASVSASVVGVYSGIVLSQLSYIANQIYPIANLAPFSVRVLEIMHRRREVVDMEVTPHPANGEQPEHLHPVRRATAIEKMKTYLEPPAPMMRSKTISPHNVLSVASTLLTMGLLAWAIVIEDGPAALAIVFLASATTMFCAASLWNPPGRQSQPHQSFVPAGDVVIRTKEGAFLIIKCTEDVARELYFGTDDISQVLTTGFGSCVGAGTVVFMVAVILMGNASWTMQAALAVTYLVLNAVYWFVALLPSTTHWEFPRYEWRDVTPQDTMGADKVTDPEDSQDGRPSQARSLWYAIRETKMTNWVSRSGAADETEVWEKWTKEAGLAARSGHRSWAAVQRLSTLRMKERR